jgi:hypothetical protein
MKLLVTGCERSGTSALSNLVAMAANKSLYDDHPESWLFYPAIYQGYFCINPKLFIDINRYSIVKVPGFITIHKQLRVINLFRRFKVIHIVRNPVNVISSIMELYTNGYGELMLYNEWLGIRNRNQIKALALRWKAYVQIAEELNYYNNSVEILRYEDFKIDKRSTVRNIGESLGWATDISVIESSLDKQFRKPYSASLDSIYRLSSDQKIIIQEVCGELMRKYNYTI